jgi:hypothetical protein
MILLLSAASLSWMLVIVWRVLKQLRLRFSLILIGVAYVLWLSATLLTTTSDLPPSQIAWEQTKHLTVSGIRSVRDFGLAVLSAPREFRLAYTGHRAPVVFAYLDKDDTRYLTPIPANSTAQKSPEIETESSRVEEMPSSEVTVQPSPTPAMSPDCPHKQAYMDTPRTNQVVENTIHVEGAACIDAFDYYKFEIRREDIEDEWHWLASYDKAVEDGELANLDISALPAGTYTLRMMVIDQTANYPFPPCEVRIEVDH